MTAEIEFPTAVYQSVQRETAIVSQIEVLKVNVRKRLRIDAIE